MTENITEEQFKKFCKDFVEKYEGRNFQELIKSLGNDRLVVYTGKITKNLKFITCNGNLSFQDLENEQTVFWYRICFNYVFVDVYNYSTDFYTIEDLYKFFKLNEKETGESSNFSMVTFDVSLEVLKKEYIKILSEKHNITMILEQKAHGFNRGMNATDLF